MTVEAALPVASRAMPTPAEEDEDDVKVFKTEGDASESSAQPAPDIIGDDKKDMEILAEQENSGAAAKAAPWNPALGGASTSKLPPPPKPAAFRPAAHPASMPSTSGEQTTPMSVYVPGSANFPPNFCFFPVPQWSQGQGLSGLGSGGYNGGPPPAHAASLEASKLAAAAAWSPSFAALSPHFGAAGLSPAYESLLPLHMAQMQQMRNFSPLSLGAGAPSPQTNFSPLPSPNTGTPITVQPAKSVNEQLFMQQMMAFNASKMMQQSLAPSFNPRNFGFGGGGNPLMSLGSLAVPRVAHSVTSLANSLAAESAAARERSAKKEPRERAPRSRAEDKEPHIKKPLNAFMLFMKENRAKMQEEKGFKERQSAELNKEMGRMWHLLSQDEQQKYYTMAKEERQRHQAQFPGWSARDNYAIHKKKKRKREKTQGDPDSLELKKCRARFGLDNQLKWCKHCKRKKKCLWFRDGPGSHRNPDDHSPVQVSSTTQGSPQESEASTTSSSAAVPLLPAHLGPSAAKMPRLDHPAALLASPSAVSSTTHKLGKDDDESEDDDSDDDVSDASDEDEDEEDVLLHNNNKPPALPSQPPLKAVT